MAYVQKKVFLRWNRGYSACLSKHISFITSCKDEQMEQVAYFRFPQNEQQQDVFVRVDDPVIVKIITQKEYTAIAGSAE